MPAGRPTKYRDDMPEKVRAFLSEGYTKEAAAGELGISVSRFCVWQNEIEEFREAIKEGEALSQKWWEDKGREACLNGEFNATVWVMQMKNRFGWTDKQSHEVTGKDGGPVETKSKVLQVVGVDAD